MISCLVISHCNEEGGREKEGERRREREGGREKEGEVSFSFFSLCAFSFHSAWVCAPAKLVLLVVLFDQISNK